MTTHPMKGTPMNTPQEEQPTPNIPADQGARQARYAEAIDGVWDESQNSMANVCALLTAVVAVADVEQAELRADVERLSYGWTVASAEAERLGSNLSALLCDLTAGRLSKTTYDVRTMISEIEAQFEDDGNERAESAEAELRALREGIEALADEFRRLGNACGGESPRAVAFYEAAGKTERRLSAPEAPCTCDPGPEGQHTAYCLRALLAPSPAATTGEAERVPQASERPRIPQAAGPWSAGRERPTSRHLRRGLTGDEPHRRHLGARRLRPLPGAYHPRVRQRLPPLLGRAWRAHGKQARQEGELMTDIDVTMCPTCDQKGRYEGRVLINGRGFYTCPEGHRWQNADERPTTKGVALIPAPVVAPSAEGSGS